MKVLRFLAASFLTLSIVGCCCGRNVVCDTCDPCGGGVPTCGGGFLRNHSLKNLFGGCLAGRRCGGCSSAGCCGATACADCGAPASFDSFPGSPMTSSGCGCSQGGTPGSMQTYGDPNSSFQIPTTVPSNGSASAPNLNSVPTPSVAPSPPQTISPNGDSSTMIPSSATVPIQTVTYEEFQKLPGTIVSGPGVGTNTIPTQTMAPPSTVAAPISVEKAVGSTQRLVPRPTTNMPVAAVSPGQKPVWIPVR